MPGGGGYVNNYHAGVRKEATEERQVLMYLQPLQNVLHNNANFGVFHPSSVNRDQFSPGNYSKGKKKKIKNKHFLSFLQGEEKRNNMCTIRLLQTLEAMVPDTQDNFSDLSGVNF